MHCSLPFACFVSLCHGHSARCLASFECIICSREVSAVAHLLACWQFSALMLIMPVAVLILLDVGS